MPTHLAMPLSFLRYRASSRDLSRPKKIQNIFPEFLSLGTSLTLLLVPGSLCRSDPPGAACPGHCSLIGLGVGAEIQTFSETRLIKNPSIIIKINIKQFILSHMEPL